jgi:hypothetical protein
VLKLFPNAEVCAETRRGANGIVPTISAIRARGEWLWLNSSVDRRCGHQVTE